MENKTFVLVWRYGNGAWVVAQGSASLCQSKRTDLKNQPQYKGGKLLVRTFEGFKVNPLWDGKTNK